MSVLKQVQLLDEVGAYRFFFEKVEEVLEGIVKETELMHVSSFLAHFSTTSRFATATLPSPVDLSHFFEVFVLDKSQSSDPEILELGGVHCLFLTGFFRDQMMRKHNIAWYEQLGSNFYLNASQRTSSSLGVKRSVLFRMGKNFIPGLLLFKDLIKVWRKIGMIIF